MLDTRGDDPFPSIPTLASDCSISRTTAKAKLRELEAAGWLRVTYRTTESGDADTNRYELTCPYAVVHGGGGRSAGDPPPTNQGVQQNPSLQGGRSAGDPPPPIPPGGSRSRPRVGREPTPKKEREVQQDLNPKNPGADAPAGLAEPAPTETEGDPMATSQQDQLAFPGLPPTPEPEPAPPPKPPQSEITRRAWALTDAFAATRPRGMCKRNAIHGVAKAAVESGEATDDEIRAALLRLSARNRPVTLDNLGAELRPAAGNGQVGSPAHNGRAQNGLWYQAPADQSVYDER